jgi:hypothetical protein
MSPSDNELRNQENDEQDEEQPSKGRAGVNRGEPQNPQNEKHNYQKPEHLEPRFPVFYLYINEVITKAGTLPERRAE